MIKSNKPFYLLICLDFAFERRLKCKWLKFNAGVLITLMCFSRKKILQRSIKRFFLNSFSSSKGSTIFMSSISEQKDGLHSSPLLRGLHFQQIYFMYYWKCFHSIVTSFSNKFISKWKKIFSLYIPITFIFFIKKLIVKNTHYFFKLWMFLLNFF